MCRTTCFRVLLLLLLLALGVECQQLRKRGTKKPTGISGIQEVSRAATRQHQPSSGVQDERGPLEATAGDAAAAALHPTQTNTIQPDSTATAAAVSCAAPGQYAQVDIRPLRLMWNSSSGFCGETSVQMIALTKGVWVSQRQARLLGSSGDMTSDVIFDGRTDDTGLYFLLAQRLGFDQPGSSYWSKDNQTLTPGQTSKYTGAVQPSADEYMTWVKHNIIAGRAVITAVRVFGDTPDVWYDHIVPVFGVCSTEMATAGSALHSSDSFSLTSDYKDEQQRPISDAHFFANWKQCPYDDTEGQVGCIASDTYNFGLAVGGLAAPAGLYLPSRLVITGWSDKTPPTDEPGEHSEAVGGSALASYRVIVSGLVRNRTYTTYRLQGPLTGFKLPQSAAQLAAECASRGAGCKTRSFRAISSRAVLNHAGLGKFPANSIQYFLTVRRPQALESLDTHAAAANVAPDSISTEGADGP